MDLVRPTRLSTETKTTRSARESTGHGSMLGSALLGRDCVRRRRSLSVSAFVSLSCAIRSACCLMPCISGPSPSLVWLPDVSLGVDDVSGYHTTAVERRGTHQRSALAYSQAMRCREHGAVAKTRKHSPLASQISCQFELEAISALRSERQPIQRSGVAVEAASCLC